MEILPWHITAFVLGAAVIAGVVWLVLAIARKR